MEDQNPSQKEPKDSIPDSNEFSNLNTTAQTSSEAKYKISQETKLLIDNKVKIIMTKIIDIDTDENTNLDNKDFLKLIHSNIESIKNTIYILHLLSKEILFKEV